MSPVLLCAPRRSSQRPGTWDGCGTLPGAITFSHLSQRLRSHSRKPRKVSNCQLARREKHCRDKASAGNNVAGRGHAQAAAPCRPNASARFHSVSASAGLGLNSEGDAEVRFQKQPPLSPRKWPCFVPRLSEAAGGGVARRH